MTQACLQQSPFLHSVQTPGPVTSGRLLVVCVHSRGAFGLAFSLLSAVCFNAQYTELAPPTTVVQGSVRDRAHTTVHCGLSRRKHGVGDIL